MRALFGRDTSKGTGSGGGVGSEEGRDLLRFAPEIVVDDTKREGGGGEAMAGGEVGDLSKSMSSARAAPALMRPRPRHIFSVSSKVKEHRGWC